MANQNGIKMLEVKDVHAAVDGKEILQGFNLSVKSGEIHAIMGPNGSGKSTFAHILAGHESYEMTKGKILFQGKNIKTMSPDERACRGIFLGFQYPVEIPGVTGTNFLRTALNSIRRFQKRKELNAAEFLKMLRKTLDLLEMDESLIKRSVNTGFSGGEKKRYEIIQMALLEPRLAILDETDSGLDIDALKLIARGITRMRDSKRSMILITHYQRLLEYVKPDRVHILSHGKIIKSGKMDIVERLEKGGYSIFKNSVLQGPESIPVSAK